MIVVTTILRLKLDNVVQSLPTFSAYVIVLRQHSQIMPIERLLIYAKRQQSSETQRLKLT
ncbi:hypothetical protein ACFP1C_09805 [Levilactobacillus fujinensis]|uniref:Transposase n=1 Tax=Levilactobacillus fujinensis TaxID=2486024 RepID=A0ABW1TID1_9LACO